jgi:1D-myo-inositol-tetrakisphosphate 5-kinase/inositol-polyphosphate multikinase
VLHSILVRLVSDLRQIREAVNSVEMRMVGGSVLIVYEGDEESAVKGLEKMKELESKDQDEEDEDEDEDEEEDTTKEKIVPAYVAKLIDFAHTRLVSGQGPDEGVVRGLDTLIRLVDERIAAVSKA